MPDHPSHIWIVAPYTRDCERLRQRISVDRDAVYILNGHRQARGSYTGTGEFLRQFVPEIHRLAPELVTAHVTALLSIAPELQAFLPMPSELRLAMEAPRIDAFAQRDEDGNKTTAFHTFPNAQQTLPLANSVITFLQQASAVAQLAPFAVVYQQMHEADPLDQELIALLLRRGDPRRMQVIIETRTDAPDALSPTFHAALKEHTVVYQAKPLAREDLHELTQRLQLPVHWATWCHRVDRLWAGEGEALASLRPYLDLEKFQPESEVPEQQWQIFLPHLSSEARLALARQYVDEDGTSENILQWLVYERFDPEARKRLHDQRADALEEASAWTYILGAIPFHRERGSQATSVKALALARATNYHVSRGYYVTGNDLAERGYALLDPEDPIDHHWFFIRASFIAAVAQEQFERAESLLNKICALTSSPIIHRKVSHLRSMLYARYFPAAQQDYQLARVWIHNAIAISQLLPMPVEKKSIANCVENNALALIAYRSGNLQEALRLVSNTLTSIDFKPGPLFYYKIALLHSRAQVYAALGQLEQAFADYHELIELDPRYSQYYQERGNLYRKAGQYEQALADYHQAIRYSLPVPNIYYNRALLYSQTGKHEQALADYTYTLELDPRHINARVNRASLYYEYGLFAEARQDTEQGLMIEPENILLLTTRGLIEMEEGNKEQAYNTFSFILQRDPSLVAVWVNRGVLRYEQEDLDGSIQDLSQALQLEESASIRYNRGFAYQAKACWQLAISDYSHALALPDADEQETLYQRALCYLQVGETDLARRDLEQHLALGPSTHCDEIQALGTSFPQVLDHLQA